MNTRLKNRNQTVLTGISDKKNEPSIIAIFAIAYAAFAIVFAAIALAVYGGLALAIGTGKSPWEFLKVNGIIYASVFPLLVILACLITIFAIYPIAKLTSKIGGDWLTSVVSSVFAIGFMVAFVAMLVWSASDFILPLFQVS